MLNLRIFLARLAKDYELKIVYNDFNSSLYEFIEGFFSPEERTISIDLIHYGGVDEGLILAHEFGHFCEFICKGEYSSEEFEREKFANNFMVLLAEKFNLKEKAIRLAQNRMKKFSIHWEYECPDIKLEIELGSRLWARKRNELYKCKCSHLLTRWVNSS